MSEYPLVLVPAYGRKYNTVQDAVQDYLAGKDFKLLHTGQYCSCRDFQNIKVSLYFGNGLYEPITARDFENGKTC